MVHSRSDRRAPCPYCMAVSGEPCRDGQGDPVSWHHAARMAEASELDPSKLLERIKQLEKLEQKNELAALRSLVHELWARINVLEGQPKVKGIATIDAERAQLAAAAPEMARLLLEMRDENGPKRFLDWAYWIEDIERVLRKAGVIETSTAAVTVGPKVSIEDLPESDARSIFGDGVYESWRKWRDDGSKPTGRLVVTRIDREGGTITVNATEKKT